MPWDRHSVLAALGQVVVWIFSGLCHPGGGWEGRAGVASRAQRSRAGGLPGPGWMLISVCLGCEQ